MRFVVLGVLATIQGASQPLPAHSFNANIGPNATELLSFSIGWLDAVTIAP